MLVKSRCGVSENWSNLMDENFDDVGEICGCTF